MSIIGVFAVAAVAILAATAVFAIARRSAVPSARRAAAAVFCGAAAMLVFLGAAQFLRYFTGLGGRIRFLISLLVGLGTGLLVWRSLARRAAAAIRSTATPAPTEAFSAAAVGEPTTSLTDDPAAHNHTVPPQPEVPLSPQALAGVCHAAAMGYLFIYFNINLGTLDILPDWMGYLFILNELGVLAGWQPAALLLRPLGVLLAAFNGLEWLCAIFSIDIGAWPVLPLVMQVVNLYFHFQLLTNLADAVRQYQPDEADGILKLRTVNTLFLTLLALPLPWQQWEYAALVLMVLSVVVTVALWWRLRVARSALLEMDPEAD